MIKIVPGVCCAFVVALAGILTAAAVVTPINFDPHAACVGNERLVAQALTAYVQDYDDTLPPMQTAARFDSVLAPYVSTGSSAFLCPDTGIAYRPNATLSFKSIYSLPKSSTVEIFEDAIPHTDRSITAAYLSGDVRTNGVLDGDPNWLCVQNAQRLALAVSQYTEDYDERLPPMQTQRAFEAAVLPYSDGPENFVCPATGEFYAPNASLSFSPIAAIANLSNTVLFKDTTPHSDGTETVAYVNGQVLHGTLPINTETCLGNEKQIGLAISQYVQDNDESLPPMDTYAHFEQALMPYVEDVRIFTCPDTGLPYQVNTSLNGLNIEDINDPSSTWILEDKAFNNNGTVNFLYVDGHVKGQVDYYPAELTVGSDHNAALVWYEIPTNTVQNLAANMQIWDLTTSLATSHKNSYLFPYPYVAPRPITDVATATGDQRLIMGGPVGPNTTTPLNALVSTTATTSTGAVSATSEYGPFDGWQVMGISNAPSGSAKILLQSHVGTLAVWTLNARGSYVYTYEEAATESQKPVGFCSSPDGTDWILLENSNGTADLWRVSAWGSVGTRLTFVNPGATLRGLALNSASLPVLLWSGTPGSAQLWSVTTTGTVTARVSLSMPAQWTASQVVVNSSGNYVVLWKALGCLAAVQSVKPTGSVSSVANYSPFQ